MEIPVKMEVSYKLKFGREGLLNLYDADWNLIQTIDTSNRMPNLVNGKIKLYLIPDSKVEHLQGLILKRKPLDRENF